MVQNQAQILDSDSDSDLDCDVHLPANRAVRSDVPKSYISISRSLPRVIIATMVVLLYDNSSRNVTKLYIRI